MSEEAFARRVVPVPPRGLPQPALTVPTALISSCELDILFRTGYASYLLGSERSVFWFLSRRTRGVGAGVGVGCMI